MVTLLGTNPGVKNINDLSIQASPSASSIPMVWVLLPSANLCRTPLQTLLGSVKHISSHSITLLILNNGRSFIACAQMILTRSIIKGLPCYFARVLFGRSRVFSGLLAILVLHLLKMVVWSLLRHSLEMGEAPSLFIISTRHRDPDGKNIKSVCCTKC